MIIFTIIGVIVVLTIVINWIYYNSGIVNSKQESKPIIDNTKYLTNEILTTKVLTYQNQMKNVSSIYEIRSVLRSINANMNIAIENHNYNLFPKSGLLEMINKIRENENSNQKNETSDLRLQLIFLTVINSTYNSIFDRVLKNDEGIIEFMIFKLCVFKNSLEKNFKNETELIQEFNNLFYTFLKDALPEMDEEFMRNRYLFYIEVFKLMENTFDWLPATVQILFFSSPLIDEPKEPTVFNNLEELIHFQYQLKILKRGMENFLSLVVNEIPIKN